MFCIVNNSRGIPFRFQQTDTVLCVENGMWRHILAKHLSVKVWLTLQTFSNSGIITHKQVDHKLFWGGFFFFFFITARFKLQPFCHGINKIQIKAGVCINQKRDAWCPIRRCFAGHLLMNKSFLIIMMFINVWRSKSLQLFFSNSSISYHIPSGQNYCIPLSHFWISDW